MSEQPDYEVRVTVNGRPTFELCPPNVLVTQDRAAMAVVGQALAEAKAFIDAWNATRAAN